MNKFVTAALGAALVFTGCDSIKDAMSAHADVVAKAADQELTSFMETLSKSVFYKSVNLIRSQEQQSDKGVLKSFEVSCDIDRDINSQNNPAGGPQGSPPPSPSGGH